MSIQSQSPTREQLLAVCDTASALTWHIRRYWSIDGKALSEPILRTTVANAKACRNLVDLYRAIAGQRTDYYPGPVIEWQLRELVADWLQLRAGKLGFELDIFGLSYTPPIGLINSMPIPSIWSDWGQHVPDLVRLVVINAHIIVQPLSKGPPPKSFDSADINALDESIEALREAIRFVPSSMQELILQELEKGPATSGELMTLCGSKETLYGKKGRGGLKELVDLGIVKNARTRGGYYLTFQSTTP